MLKKIRSVEIYVVCSLLLVTATQALAIETGVASYYSDRFQGRKTASGEKYDRNKLTAAHRTLPIGSQIEVTNLKNQNSVVVTINDRGPYAGGRKLDLSYAAAKELGLVAMGTAPVTFDLVKPEKNSDFEKVIPVEYSPGVLGLAKSEEEVIEAEEELANSAQTVTKPTTVAVEKEVKTDHPQKIKKTAEKPEKTVVKHDKSSDVGKVKEHPLAQAEKKSDKHQHKSDSKVKHIAKSEKDSVKAKKKA
jgi:rare lipoprotein A